MSQALLFASGNPLIGLLRLILANHVADSTAMEHLVELSDTDWTIVRPPRLRDGGTSHGYKVEAGALRPGGPCSAGGTPSRSTALISSRCRSIWWPSFPRAHRRDKQPARAITIAVVAGFTSRSPQSG